MTKATAETNADSGAARSAPGGGASAGPGDADRDDGRESAGGSGMVPQQVGSGPEGRPGEAGEAAGPQDALYADRSGERSADPELDPDDELPDARALWIVAFTFAAFGLFFPLAGLIAVGCGALAWRRGSGQGRIATFVALGTTLIGVLLTIIVLLR
ncbi:DUF4190 domain-containing protein [Frankia sp. AiPs1]|uniref:hypothetical protein n=1 Tax=Frankia sp. AiPa1 TaxID=573492 RepID=UPI00202B0C53|nr:hypothetical protein [Frankia sp. AiPa1]MCL9759935.1 hypothetical protein [Frankia sp. AiPa1]